MSETARITQVWPAELKEAVRERVGGRGLTEFTVRAVQLHLDADSEDGADGELKQLVQLLADQVAWGGSEEERRAVLADLPAWVETTDWPASVKAKPLPTDEELLAEERRANEERFGVPKHLQEQEPKPPVLVEAGDDFLARVQAKALEKGVDLKPIGLRPASAIESPAAERIEAAIAEATAKEVAPVESEVVETAFPMQEPAAKPDPNRCPECGDELVAGECWSCA